MTDGRRVLLVTRNMPPLIGGMERLNWHMADELSRLAQVRVVAPVGSARLAPEGIRVTEVPLRPLWKFLAHVSLQSLRDARSWKPHVVLAGSGLTALPVLLAARATGARAAVYVHGLDLTVSNMVYRRIWLPAIRRMDCVIANSRATARLAEQCGVDPERIGIVHPGVQLPKQLPGTDDVARFRNEHGFGARPLLVSVGRLSARKGLREFVSHALPRIVAACPDALLVIVGHAPNDALHAEAQTPQYILDAAKQAGLQESVRFLGIVSDELLEVVYQAADVHVFPVREIPGDPEGFGMVAVEAAAHGLPTIAFAAGGVVDAVSDGQSGRLIACGDYAAMADSAIEALTTAAPGARASCREFARRFAWPEFGKKVAARLLAAPASSPA